MTSSLLRWWTKTKDLSLASLVRPREVIHFSIVISVFRAWLKMSYLKANVVVKSLNLVFSRRSCADLGYDYFNFLFYPIVLLFCGVLSSSVES